MASEIDFDSTIVGGSVELVDAIFNDPVLEAHRVGPDDGLTDDADHLDPVSDRSSD